MDINGTKEITSYKLILVPQICGNLRENPNQNSTYKLQKDTPFIELFFHYDLGGKSYLSPTSFGKVTQSKSLTS